MCVDSTVVDACFMQSEYAATVKAKKQQDAPLPIASSRIESLPEFSTSVSATLYVMMRWANTLQSDDEKKAAASMMERFIKSRLCNF